MRLSKVRAPLFSIIALALLVAACGGGDDGGASTSPPVATTVPGTTTVPQPTAPPTPTSAPVPTGELSMGLASMGAFELVIAEGTGTVYLDAIYDHAIGVDDNNALDAKSGLATSWSVDATGTVWTVKLRNDVFFHNGDKAGAVDIKATIERTMDPASNRAAGIAYKRDIAKMETPDEQTFVLTLNRRNIFFSRSIGSNYVEPFKYIAEKGVPFANRNAVGTGPYKFKSLVLDDRVVTEAVDKHWFLGVPRTKTLTFRLVPEESTRVALLKSNTIDFTTLSRAIASSVRSTQGLKVIARDESGITTYRFESQWVTEYPGGMKNPFADVRVRKALNWYAIDRDKLVRTFLEGAGSPTMAYQVTAGEPAYKPLPIPPYNVNKAKELLREAGFEKGFEMDMFIWPRPALPEGPQMMEAIAVWWEGLGIKVNRKPIEYAAWRDALIKANTATPEKGAYSRPTASGMYFLGNSTAVGPSAGQGCSGPFGGFAAAKPNQQLCDLGKLWENATNDAEYIQRGQAWMAFKYELSEDPVLTTVGDLFGVGPKMPAQWNPGKSSFSYRLERAAGMRY